MRVIFAGTPEFAARALQAIVDARFEVPLVLTQPDRPAGRGQNIAQSAVRTLAARLAIPVWQPEKLRTDEQQAPLLDVAADVMVVAAYGLILPLRVLDHPAHGCLNIHASLLPRWRGAAPIQRALLAGDRETGVCIMQMDAGLDTGAVVSSHAVGIEDADTAGTLHDRLAATGADAIVGALRILARDHALRTTPQPEDGVTYASKITRDEAKIDWSRSADEIVRNVRAFNPAPGAFTSVAGERVKIWAARKVASGPRPGALALVGENLLAGCGNGEAISLDQIQPAGGRRMNGASWARGRADLSSITRAT